MNVHQKVFSRVTSAADVWGGNSLSITPGRTCFAHKSLVLSLQYHRLYFHCGEYLWLQPKACSREQGGHDSRRLCDSQQALLSGTISHITVGTQNGRRSETMNNVGTWTNNTPEPPKLGKLSQQETCPQHCVKLLLSVDLKPPGALTLRAGGLSGGGRAATFKSGVAEQPYEPEGHLTNTALAWLITIFYSVELSSWLGVVRCFPFVFEPENLSWHFYSLQTSLTIIKVPRNSCLESVTLSEQAVVSVINTAQKALLWDEFISSDIINGSRLHHDSTAPGFAPKCSYSPVL